MGIIYLNGGFKPINDSVKFNKEIKNLKQKITNIENSEPQKVYINATVDDSEVGYVEGSGYYYVGTQVTLKFIRYGNYKGSKVFTKWSDGSTSTSRTFVAEKDLNIQAIVETPAEVFIGTSVNDSRMGSVSGMGTYEYGTEVILRATPNAGYRFVSWGDGSTENPKYIIATVNGATYSAIFEADNSGVEQIFIGTSVNDSRMGSVSGMGTYDKGTTVTLTATPNPGYVFISWGDDVTDNPRMIKAEVNGATYSAIFASEDSVEQIFIGTGVNDSKMGSVTGMGTYIKGHTVTLKATANAGYRFVEWGDGNTDNPRVIKAEVNGATYQAFFEAVVQVFVQVSANDPEMGNVTGTGTYTTGTSVELEAIPNNGYHFVEWNDGNTDNPRYIKVGTKDVQYVATFAEGDPIKQIFIGTSVNDSRMGSVTPFYGTYDYGTTVTLTATPNAGYRFVSWGDDVTDNPRVVKAEVNGATYSAIFEAIA